MIFSLSASLLLFPLHAAPVPEAPSPVRMQRSARIERVLVTAGGEIEAIKLADGSVVFLAGSKALDLAEGQTVQVEGDAVRTPVNFEYRRVRLTRAGKVLLRPAPAEITVARQSESAR